MDLLIECDIALIGTFSLAMSSSGRCPRRFCAAYCSRISVPSMRRSISNTGFFESLVVAENNCLTSENSTLGPRISSEPGSLGELEGLLQEEDRLHHARLAGAICACEDGQGPNLDLLLLFN